MTKTGPKKFFVVGNNYRQATIDCFNSQGEDVLIHTTNLEEADIFIFTGGEDIDPGIYGDRRLKVSHYNPKRDKEELDVFHKIPKDKIKIGICRGAQLLNCLAGGRLWQDVNNHQGGHHAVYMTGAKGLVEGDCIVTNSIHHQMMIPTYKADVLGVAYESTKRLSGSKDLQGSIFTDPEIVWYKEEKHFCFQAHPEFGHKPTTELFFKTLKHLDII